MRHHDPGLRLLSDLLPYSVRSRFFLACFSVPARLWSPPQGALLTAESNGPTPPPKKKEELYSRVGNELHDSGEQLPK